MCGKGEWVLRVDSRERVVIPAEVRRALNVGRVVKMYVRGGVVVLEPIKDPFEEVSELVEEVSLKVSEEPWRVGEIASEQLLGRKGEALFVGEGGC